MDHASSALLVERGHWDPLRSTVLLAYCVSLRRLAPDDRPQARGKEVVLKQGATRTRKKRPVFWPFRHDQRGASSAPHSRSYYV